MATIDLSPEFKEFLKLLTSYRADYLVVGGYAVGYHGYPRATGDIDIWIDNTEDNAVKVEKVIRKFGFDVPQLSIELLLTPGKVIRMGEPPVRIEILTSISGVEFPECQQRAISDTIDGVEVKIICLEDLLANKRASGRHKDLEDVEQLS